MLFDRHPEGKRPAPARPPRPLRHERMSAVEARALFPVGGAGTQRRGRFPVVAKEFRTLDGIKFASKLEMEFYAELKQRELGGEVINIRYQPSLDVEIEGKHFCTFTPDFAYRELAPEFGERIVEVKSSGSRKDKAYKLRRKAAQLYHDIVVIEVVRGRS